MSLLLVARKLWNYKLVTLPIAALALAASFYVIAIQAPTYEASATYILIPPPSPPQGTSPSGASNPYSRLSDPSVLVEVLASQLSSDEFRRSLASRGVRSTYKAQPSAEFGFSAPIMRITATGTTEAEAVNTANAVGRALDRQLTRMQKVRGVNQAYWITTEAVVPAAHATLKASGKLRSIIAIFVLGAILLFMAIALLDVIGDLRRERAQAHSAEDGADPGSTAGPAPDRSVPDGAPGVPPRAGAGWDRPLPALDPESLR